MKCPICGGKSVGRVGHQHYYCWDCFVEYQFVGDSPKVFSVQEDGSLIDYCPFGA